MFECNLMKDHTIFDEIYKFHFDESTIKHLKSTSKQTDPIFTMEENLIT